jgi:hypothetical protein
MTEALWDAAESFDGPIVQWLQRTSKRFGIYLGLTFLEADGEDFFNTFGLGTPAGTIAGRVRKSPPASLAGSPPVTMLSGAICSTPSRCLAARSLSAVL